MTKNGYAVLDSDLHVYEPEDLYDRYLDERYAARVPRVFPRRAPYTPQQGTYDASVIASAESRTFITFAVMLCILGLKAR